MPEEGKVVKFLRHYSFLTHKTEHFRVQALFNRESLKNPATMLEVFVFLFPRFLGATLDKLGIVQILKATSILRA